jgi:hypothetical protein
MTGICPKCKAPVTSLNGETVNISSPGGNWVGATFSCPICSAVLGAGIDPVALKDAIVDELTAGIKKLR